MIISIEGCDQAGKNTQCGLLINNLKESGLKIARYDFPNYMTLSGKKIKDILNNGGNFDLLHELLAVNMNEQMDEIKLDAKRYDACVMNRYLHSNYIYGSLHGINEEKLILMMKSMPDPDLVILLDCKIEDIWEREVKKDVIEADRKFLEMVVAKYKNYAKEHNNWICIKNDDITSMSKEIYNKVKLRIKKENHLKMQAEHALENPDYCMFRQPEHKRHNYAYRLADLVPGIIA